MSASIDVLNPQKPKRIAMWLLGKPKSRGEKIEMREFIIWTLLLIMMTIVAVAAYVASQGASQREHASNGFLRDGIHLGTLDAKNGKMPHLARGPTNRRQSWKGGRTLKQPHFPELSALKKSARKRGSS